MSAFGWVAAGMLYIGSLLLAFGLGRVSATKRGDEGSADG